MVTITLVLWLRLPLVAWIVTLPLSGDTELPLLPPDPPDPPPQDTIATSRQIAIKTRKLLRRRRALARRLEAGINSSAASPKLLSNQICGRNGHAGSFIRALVVAVTVSVAF